MEIRYCLNTAIRFNNFTVQLPPWQLAQEMCAQDYVVRGLVRLWMSRLKTCLNRFKENLRIFTKDSTE